MEILAWELEKYVVWIDSAEYHFFNEERMLQFVNTYANKVTHIQKIMKGVVGK